MCEISVEVEVNGAGEGMERKWWEWKSKMIPMYSPECPYFDRNGQDRPGPFEKFRY